MYFSQSHTNPRSLTIVTLAFLPTFSLQPPVSKMATSGSTSDSASQSLKTSQRVNCMIAKYKVNEEPIHVNPDEVGADWCNRQGQAPTILICHQVIAKSFKTDGFDTGKPQVGVCRSFKGNEHLMKKLLSWNVQFGMGDERFPPVLAEKMDKGSLACTHLNMTARMYTHQMTTVDGIRCVVEHDKALAELLRIGHKWWVLSADTPDDVANEISAWFNSQNNSSQVTHEVEHVRALQKVCCKEMQTAQASWDLGLCCCGCSCKRLHIYFHASGSRCTLFFLLNRM